MHRKQVKIILQVKIFSLDRNVIKKRTVSIFLQDLFKRIQKKILNKKKSALMKKMFFK